MKEGMYTIEKIREWSFVPTPATFIGLCFSIFLFVYSIYTFDYLCLLGSVFLILWVMGFNYFGYSDVHYKIKSKEVNQ